MRPVLIVDDEESIREILVRGLSDGELAPSPVASGEEALARAREMRFDVAILDIRMPDMDGIELLRRLKEASPETEVIMLTADATLERALQAMRLGAYDFLTKPFHLRAVKETCLKAIEKVDLRRRAGLLERELAFKAVEARLVGTSAPIARVIDLIRQVAPTNSPVLIGGESGTGKELVARAVHDASPRRGGSFIAVNCGAFQESLLESELFGHKKGAFTGALFDKPGLFDVADGGTLFLDEVGEMSLAMQVKLLRVLDTRQFRPIGDTRERGADFRLLAATNRDLKRMIAEKTFREDLYYRLNVVAIEMPPLRERLGDLPELVDYIIRSRGGVKGAGRRPSAALMRAFMAYGWPGNVRELVNQIERSLILSPSDELEPIGFSPAELAGQPGSLRAAPLAADGSSTDSIAARPGRVAAPPGPFPSAVAAGSAPGSTLADQEKAAILETLERHHGNVSRAAADLGIDRRTLHRKLKGYGMTRHQAAL